MTIAGEGTTGVDITVVVTILVGITVLFDVTVLFVTSFERLLVSVELL